MNPDDGFRRLNDPDEWEVTLRPRADAIPARRKPAPWVVSLATIAAVAIVGIVVFSVFGLGVQNVRQPAAPAVPSDTNTSIPTVSSTPLATPSPVGTGTTAQNDNVPCTELLDDETLTTFAHDDMSVTDAAWVQKVIDEAAAHPSKEPGLATVANYGGTICGWGTASENTLLYGFGPITDDQAATVRAWLVAHDYSKIPGVDRYEDYCDSDVGPNAQPVRCEAFEFADGHWAMYQRNGGADVLDEVVRNGLALVAVAEAATSDAEPAAPATAPYLTTEGLGDLRLGDKIPVSNAFTVWDDSVCGERGGWALTKAFGGNTNFDMSFVTRDRTKNSPLTNIVLRNDTIPTKSGIRVGDSLATLTATYKKFDQVLAYPSAIYVIEGDKGEVAFELIDDTIVSIALFPIGTEYLSTQNGDGLSSCSN